MFEKPSNEGVNFQGKRGINAADPINDKDVVNLRTLIRRFSVVTASTLSSICIRNIGLGYPVYAVNTARDYDSCYSFRSLSAGTNLGMYSSETITFYLNDNIVVNGITANTITSDTINVTFIDASIIYSGGSPLNFSLTERIWTASTGLESVVRNNNTGNEAQGFYSIIGGAYGYSLSNFSIIAGGSGNTSFGNYGVVSGGLGNRQYGLHSFIGGGAYNLVSGQSASVVSGFSNRTTRNFASVLGGFGNINDSVMGAIVGGNFNTAKTNYSTVIGGSTNVSSNDFSVNIGGYRNQVLNKYGLIGNGIQNIIYSGADFSTILNGRDNNIQSGASFSAIIAGSGNTIVSNISNTSILGGYNITGLSSNTIYVDHQVARSLTGSGISFVYAEADGHLVRGSSITAFTASTSVSAQNLGSGETIFSAITGGILQFKTISGGTFNTAYTYGNVVIISATDWEPGIGTGSIQNQSGGNKTSTQTGFTFGVLNINRGISNNHIIGQSSTIDSGTSNSIIFGGTNSQILKNNNYLSIIGTKNGILYNNVSYSSLINATNGIIFSGSSFSNIIGGQQNRILNNNFGSTIIGGLGRNYIYKTSYISNIIGGLNNKIGESSNLSTIIGTAAGYIKSIPTSQSAYSTILGGRINIIETGVTDSSIIGGSYNTINGGIKGSTILGGTNIIASSSYTTYVPQLNIQTVYNGGNYMLTWDSVTKSVFKSTIPGGGGGGTFSGVTNIGVGNAQVYKQTNLGFIELRSFSGGNNINIISGDTHFVNLNSNIVVNTLTATTLSSTTIFGGNILSGNTNLNNIFSPTGHTHPLTDLLGGSNGDTIRHNGTNWIANNFLYNPGHKVGINNTNLNSTFSIYSSGNTTATTSFLIYNNNNQRLLSFWGNGLMELNPISTFSTDIGTPLNSWYEKPIYPSRLFIQDWTDADSTTSGKTTVLIQGQVNNQRSGNTALWVRANVAGSPDSVAVFEHSNPLAAGVLDNSSIIRVIGGAFGVLKTGLTINADCLTAFGSGAVDASSQVLISLQNRTNMSSFNALKLIDNNNNQLFKVRGDAQVTIRSLTGSTTQMVVADAIGILSVQSIPSSGGGGGSVASAINTGGTHGIFAGLSGSSVIVLKSLSGTSNISVYSSATENAIYLNPYISVLGLTATTLSASSLSISDYTSGGTSLQNIFVTSGTNVGNGSVQLFKNKVGSDLNFKTLSAVTPLIQLDDTNDVVTIVPNIQQPYLLNDISTTSNILSDITGLEFLINSGETWTFNLYGQMSCSTVNGMIFNVAAPNGSEVRVRHTSNTNTVTSFRTSIINTNSGNTSTVSTVANTVLGWEMHGWISASTTSGNVKIKFRSGNNLDTSTILKGTYLFANKVKT